jgi:hypothetical protein
MIPINDAVGDVAVDDRVWLYGRQLVFFITAMVNRVGRLSCQAQVHPPIVLAAPAFSGGGVDSDYGDGIVVWCLILFD